VSTLTPFFHSRIMGPKSLTLHGSSSVRPTSVLKTCPSVSILGPESEDDGDAAEATALREGEVSEDGSA